ncbi:MAG: hypothetical protein QGG48_13010 [Desulfatiglandales bacterium]|nr:hypothetical protein [Desulfatiglandales bacterium]
MEHLNRPEFYKYKYLTIEVKYFEDELSQLNEERRLILAYGQKCDGTGTLINKVVPHAGTTGEFDEVLAYLHRWSKGLPDEEKIKGPHRKYEITEKTLTAISASIHHYTSALRHAKKLRASLYPKIDDNIHTVVIHGPYGNFHRFPAHEIIKDAEDNLSNARHLRKRLVDVIEWVDSVKTHHRHLLFQRRISNFIFPYTLAWEKTFAVDVYRKMYLGKWEGNSWGKDLEESFVWGAFA